MGKCFHQMLSASITIETLMVSKMILFLYLCISSSSSPSLDFGNLHKPSHMEAVDSDGYSMWWRLGSELPALLHNGEDSFPIPLPASTQLQDPFAISCPRAFAQRCPEVSYESCLCSPLGTRSKHTAYNTLWGGRALSLLSCGGPIELFVNHSRSIQN